MGGQFLLQCRCFCRPFWLFSFSPLGGHQGAKELLTSVGKLRSTILLYFFCMPASQVFPPAGISSTGCPLLDFSSGEALALVPIIQDSVAH